MLENFQILIEELECRRRNNKDANSRANFINSIAGGQKILCSKCNTLNEADSKFCASCGTPLEKKMEDNNIPFAPVKKVAEATKPVENKEFVKRVTPIQEYKEPENVFAKGLPEWNIEPPQVMVRRKRK